MSTDNAPDDASPLSPPAWHLRLRPLIRRDVNVCVRIEADSYPPSIHEGAALFEKFIKTHSSYCWVVVDDGIASPLLGEGEVVGYMLCLPTCMIDVPISLSSAPLPVTPSSKADTLYIHDMAVAPSHRKRGAALVLQQATANIARYDRLRTLTLTAVFGAATYWARKGFEEISRAGLSTEAQARLREYPSESGACLMILDLDEASAPPPPVLPERPLDLPAKLVDAPRIRLSMRLAPSATFAWSDGDGCPPPSPYRILMHGSGTLRGEDAVHAWCTIVHASGERSTVAEARRDFEREFGKAQADTEAGEDGASLLGGRMFFAVDADGQPVGTATAWFEPLADGRVGGMGRVHWLSVVPEAQGRGLGKALLKAVLQRLSSELSTPAVSAVALIPPVVLRTHSQAARAIALYLKVGFVPAPLAGGADIERFTEEEGRGWKFLANLGLPIEIPGVELE